MKTIYCVSLFLLLSACGGNTDIAACEDEVVLHEQSSSPIGVAVNVSLLEFNTAYAEIVSRHFNSITPENIFKPSYLHPAENHFDFQEADSLLSFCQSHQKRLHGHTLIWHSQLPAWMNTFQGNKTEWETMLKTHVTTIVSHFKGQVSSWDVVNEAFEEDGSFRQNIWLDHIGEAYIELAFRAAAEADPASLLFYNDFNLESSKSKRTAALDHLDGLLAKGVKIDGIGLQMHISISFPGKNRLKKAVADCTDRGYKVHFSELDIAVNPDNKEIKDLEKLFQKQGEKMAEVIEVYREMDSDDQYGMTFWGVGDADSWIPSYFGREDYPLLYDTDYQPKPAFCQFLESW